MERESKIVFSAEDKNFSQVTKNVSKSIQEMYEQISKTVGSVGNSPDFEKAISDKIKKLQEAAKKVENSIQYAGVTRRPEDVPKFVEGQKAKLSELDSEVDGLIEAAKTLREIESKKVEDEKARLEDQKTEAQQKKLEDKLDDKQKKEQEKADKKLEREKEKEDKDKDRKRDARMVDVVQTMKDIALSKTGYQAVTQSISGVTSIATGNPVINAIASLFSAVLGKAVEEGGKYQRSLANISQITGKGFYSYAPGTKYDKERDTLSEYEKEIRDRMNKNAFVKNYVPGRTKFTEEDVQFQNKNYGIIQFTRDQEVLARIENAKDRIKGSENMLSSIYDIATSMGFESAQYEALRAKASRANGSFAGAGIEALDIAAVTKGLGIDENTALTLSKQGRASGMGAYNSVEYMFGNLKNRGLMSADDTSLLPEYLQQLIEVNQRQLETLGDINLDQNAGKLGAIASLGADFENPELIKSVMPKLESTFGESQNAGFKALQYMTMSQMGETNIFDMKKKMEDPLANREYITNMIDKFKSLSGGNNQMAAWYLSQMSGGSITQTMSEKLIASDWTNFKTPQPGKGGLDIYGRAQEGIGTTPMEVSAANVSRVYQELGNEMLKDMTEIKEMFTQSRKEVAEAMKNTGIKSARVDQSLDKIDKTFTKIAKNSK